MVNTKQHTVNLGYKYRLNMMVSCVSSCMGTSFKGVDCLPAYKIRTKCNECKESGSLENTNHVKAFVIHIHKQDKDNE